MTWEKVKYAALAALVTVGLVGFGVGQWSAVSAGPADTTAGKPPVPWAARDKDPALPAKAEDSRPAAGRRREVVIRLPAGTFIKEVEVAPYGSARITWTYEDDRVLGTIEASVMGVEAELAIESEYSLSSSGAIYGVVNSVRLNHLRLPDGEQFAEIKPFVGLWPAVEPLVNEVTTDLPFSYRFQVLGDRLVISNFRILLAGPNPLGKVGGVCVGKEEGQVLAAFQALGVALEGTYTSRCKGKGEGETGGPAADVPQAGQPTDRQRRSIRDSIGGTFIVPAAKEP